MDKLHGAMKSPEDPNDFIYEHLAHGSPGFYRAEMPEEIDLDVSIAPRDQGMRGTCAAFAGCTIKEIQKCKKGAVTGASVTELMSPEFIYYHRENKPGTGMYGRNVFQILQRIGTVPETYYPYNSSKKPKKGMYDLAANYRISSFARVTTVEGLKRALLEIGPCYLQLPLFNEDKYFWRGKNGETTTFGHAVVVVGYKKKGFILKNSWGSSWNGDGRVIFPYSDWGLQWECWVSMDDKRATGERKGSCTIV